MDKTIKFILLLMMSYQIMALNRWTDISYDGNSLEAAVSFTRVTDIPLEYPFANCTHIQYLRETIFTGGPYWVDENIKCAILEPVCIYNYLFIFCLTALKFYIY